MKKMVYHGFGGIPCADGTYAVEFDPDCQPIYVFRGPYPVWGPSDVHPPVPIEGNIEDTVQQISGSMSKDGWACRTIWTAAGYPLIQCNHRATQDIINATKRPQRLRFRNAEQGYIRFGDLPPSGVSHNFAADRDEPGVSCYLAEFSADGHRRLILKDYVLEASYLGVRHRRAYRLWGAEVGTGSDGEPCISVKRSVPLPQPLW